MNGLKQPVLRFHDLAFGYPGRPVAGGLRGAVGEGEFVGVFGPNGAGKTTLLKTILGLLPPLEGSLEILGGPPRRGHPAIGYIPQQRSLPAGLPLAGIELLAGALSGARPGLPFLRRQERAEMARALALVGAENLAERPFHTLSGGERQRLLLAQALLGRPRLLLLDEPLLSLDPRHQAEFVALIARLVREEGLAVLFTAHEVNSLLGAIGRVLYLGHGRAAFGSVGEVINEATLSWLYGMPVHLVRAGGRIFVYAEGLAAEGEAHRHEAGTDALL